MDIPIYGTLLMYVCVLLLTTRAAPIMESVPRLGNDPVAQQQAFEGFYRWDSIRAVFGALGDFAILWALIAILSSSFLGPPQRAAEGDSSIAR